MSAQIDPARMDPADVVKLKQHYWVSQSREQDASGRLAEMETQFVVQVTRRVLPSSHRFVLGNLRG